MKKLIVLHKGLKFDEQGAGGRFAKDVARIGRWVHPATGQEIVFDAARLNRLAEATNRYLEAGNKVPFPAGHTTDPMKNLGHWPGPFIAHGEALVGVVEPKDATALEKIRNGVTDAVSVCIEFGISDSKGNQYDEVITHVCATDYPVVTGQQGFLQLSARPSWNETLVPAELAEDLKTKATTPEEGGTPSRRTDMKLAKVIALLGLSKDMAEDKVIEEVEKRIEASAKGGDDKVTALRQQLDAQLKAHGLKLDGEKLVKEEVKKEETAEEKRLREQLEANTADLNRLKVTAAKEQAERFVAEGKVPPAQAARLQKLLALTGKAQSLSLSADAKQAEAIALDVAAELRGLLAELPSITKDRLAQLATLTDEDRKKAQELDTRCDAIAAKVQGRKPETAAK